jgi:hypothetical protein
MIAELELSHRSAKNTGYKSIVACSSGDDIAISVANSICGSSSVFVMKSRLSVCRWANKLNALESSPFDRTLYIDTDAFILDGNHAWPSEHLRGKEWISGRTSLSHGFSMLSDNAFAACHDGASIHEQIAFGDGSTRPLLEGIEVLLSEHGISCDHFPFINGGVIFCDNRSREAMSAIEKARNIMISSRDRFHDHVISDQICLSIAFKLLKTRVHYLDEKVWNMRDYGRSIPGTKIIHHPTWPETQARIK